MKFYHSSRSLSAIPCAKATDAAGSPRDRRRREGGFTIVEVAMATFVLAFGIATSIIALQSGFKYLDVARNTTLASQVLQSEMERLRMMSWGTISGAGMLGTHAVDLSSMFTADPSLASKFTVTETIADSTEHPGEMVNITLSVAWSGFDGRRQSRSFKSYYCKNGLYDYYYTLARP